LGCDFGEKIKSEINCSNLVLAIITRNSLKSTWVNQEIGYTLGSKKDLIPVKEKSFASKGCGFIHSNIDGQMFQSTQTKFPKLDGLFEAKFGKKATKVIKPPSIMKPVKENTQVYTREAKESVVR
jgi:hypothetical protein